MTDARIPERYLVDRRVVRLSDTQRSSYFMSTLWSVSNRTDGYIDHADLPFIPTFNANVVDALVSCGLWAVTGSGWTDVEFLNVQTSKDDLEVLDNARRADREKKRRAREAKRATSDSSPSFPGSVPGTFPGDDTGEDRQGKDRQGQPGNQEGVWFSEESVNLSSGEVGDSSAASSGWPVASIPNSDSTSIADALSCITHGLNCDLQNDDCEWSYS